MSNLSPFHLAIPVRDLESSRSFYGGLLGCNEGRSAAHWVDFDFFGHQLVCHVDPSLATRPDCLKSEVDHDQVPVPHFGMVLDWDDWHKLAERLATADLEFIIEPHIRFRGLVGEQATMFFTDPSGNALEFKAFGDPARLFARET